MKKLFVMVALFAAVSITNANAQETKPAGDPGKMVEKFKERLKPLLIEKTKITDEQADKVLNIHFTYAHRIQAMTNATPDEKAKQVEIIHAAENKEYSAIPLNEDQIKSVNQFFEDQRKEMEKRRANNNMNNN